MKDPNKLKDEILAKQKELAELQKQLENNSRKLAIRELSDFTEEEKIKAFDKLYKLVISLIEKIKAEKYFDEDEKQYMWEHVMEITTNNKQAFWQYFNSITP